MKTIRPSSKFISITYVSLLAATVVAAAITKSVLTLIGGLVGAVIVVRLLVKGIN